MSYFTDVNFTVWPGQVVKDKSGDELLGYPVYVYHTEGSDLVEFDYEVVPDGDEPQQGLRRPNVLPGLTAYILRVDPSRHKLLMVMRPAKLWDDPPEGQWSQADI